MKSSWNRSSRKDWHSVCQTRKQKHTPTSALKNKEYSMEEYFEFLDDLRETGDINMFGAAPHLAAMFDLDKYESREILSAWMRERS